MLTLAAIGAMRCFCPWDRIAGRLYRERSVCDGWVGSLEERQKQKWLSVAGSAFGTVPHLRYNECLSAYSRGFPCGSLLMVRRRYGAFGDDGAGRRFLSPLTVGRLAALSWVGGGEGLTVVSRRRRSCASSRSPARGNWGLACSSVRKGVVARWPSACTV